MDKDNPTITSRQPQEIKKSTAQNDQPIVLSQRVSPYLLTPKYEDAIPFDLSGFDFNLLPTQTTAIGFKLNFDVPSSFVSSHKSFLSILINSGSTEQEVVNLGNMLESQTYAAAVCQIVNTTPPDLQASIPDSSKMKKLLPRLPNTVCATLHTLGDVDSSLGPIRLQSRYQHIQNFIRKALNLAAPIIGSALWSDTKIVKMFARQRLLRDLNRETYFWNDQCRDALINKLPDMYTDIVHAHPVTITVNNVQSRTYFYNFSTAVVQHGNNQLFTDCLQFGLPRDVAMNLQYILDFREHPIYAHGVRVERIHNRFFYSQNFTVHKAIKMLSNVQLFYAEKVFPRLQQIFKMHEFAPTTYGNACQLVERTDIHDFMVPIPVSVSDATLGFTHNYCFTTTVRTYTGQTNKSWIHLSSQLNPLKN